MPKLPHPSGAEMIRFLESQGFHIVRVRGSHHILVKDELRTTFPVHGTETLRIGTLRAILRDVEIGAAEFTSLWSSR